MTESLYGVREEAPPGPDEGERLRIFFPHAPRPAHHAVGARRDPMTQFTFTDDYDAYGQPRSQIAIAVPRGRDFRVAAAAGEPYLATHTVTTTSIATTPSATSRPRGPHHQLRDPQ